ncbi:MAG: exodeoxyribonuclease VII large subunit [Leptospiraceae bacterium]|nr:exodeoxyribonuclease VII large subunit [Leptospiraceae bacterium]MCK6379787.1 exodeoxyribonuclease VII large subunit [Leptospiraceae bacterium]NUM41358.1 exodeoxyribonuclease VII large subunit [Leptospiraceae bacterium]
MEDTKSKNKVFLVSEITKIVKTILTEEDILKNIWIRGEVSNLSFSSSGHIYFSLKDDNSILKCIFLSFNSNRYKGKKLQNGMEIQVNGGITVYEAGGYYNFNVTKVEEIGQGEILQKIENLKNKLDKMGIFNPAHKKPIPKFPKTLGIATSQTGAALHDIIKIAKERFPNINILIAPCLVQGVDAPNSIARAILELNNPEWQVDVIIAGRGGGSFEDLIAFHDEIVVMAFYNSVVPIISAVGHEVDRVLSDLSADIAAPTPTAAAKLAIPDISEVDNYIEDMERRFLHALNSKINLLQEKIISFTNKRIFQEPKSILIERYQRADEVLNRIYLLGKNYLSHKKSELQKFESIDFFIQTGLTKFVGVFNVVAERIENFSPLSTLSRGYSVTRTLKKEVVSSTKKILVGDELEVILHEGIIQVEVKKINDKNSG